MGFFMQKSSFGRFTRKKSFVGDAVVFEHRGRHPSDLCGIGIGDERQPQHVGTLVLAGPCGAMNALNPVLTMEEQFCDVIMRHTNMTRAPSSNAQVLRGGI